MSPVVVREAEALVPLCVDLDGTLTRTDTLFESIVALLRTRPASLILLPIWALRGKAAFKRAVARHVTLDPKALPYNVELLAWLESERAAGRSLWLVTAADHAVAHAVAAHVGLFDGVLASDGVHNVKAAGKLRVLRERFPNGFDYAGNSPPDLVVWRGARNAIVVNATRRLVRKARRDAQVTRVFP